MSVVFSAPLLDTSSLQPLMPSAPPPALRFQGDPLRWIGVPAGTLLRAMATGTVARAQGPSGGLPGSTLPWTLLQLSPLPQLAPAIFKAIPGGLPVQLVLLLDTVGGPPDQDDLVQTGAALAAAPAGPGATAFLAVAFQDRLCRDPLGWAEALAATGTIDVNWPFLVSALAALPGARELRILDHRGVPRSSGTYRVSVDGALPVDVTLTGGRDGGLGISVPERSRASVAATSSASPIVAAGDADAGAFEGSGLLLAPGARIAQVLDAGAWLMPPDAGVQVKRWNPDSFVEPIQEGTPYFGRLVTDLRAAKPSGKAELAGWAFVKGSLADSTIDWPLVPGDRSTTLLALIQELRTAGVDLRMLVNRFMQFDSTTLDDFPELGFILMALYGALSPAQLLFKMQTDPAGYVVGLIGVALIEVALTQPWTLDAIKSLAEYSQPLVDALDAIDPTIATWTPYPAAFADNPLVAPPPFKILGHTIDDLSHLGVYHQKYVNIEIPAVGTSPRQLVSYLGGIDLNSDRLDLTIHRAAHPFHDVQVRLTGPAVADVIRSYAERATLHGGQVPIAVPADGTVGPTGSHLVQIARTYFAPGAGSATPALTFAPSGESTPIRTLKAAIGQARDLIYLEDQYFTPPDDYVQALLDAAGQGVKALVITVPYQTDQPYGGQRRADVLAALQAAWGSRLLVGTPLRRFRHENPALTTNLGRMRLAKPFDATAATCTLSPLAHIPPPPFWAFVDGELLLVHATTGAPVGSGVDSQQEVEVVRAGGPAAWGANPVEHTAGAPVLAVQIPGIYVHAKVMVIDDTFLFVGSANVNRRGFYHDGEMNSFTVPQHLRGDPTNPARLLRCRLMAEHMGLSPEMGQALFSDPISALAAFSSRTWYQGAHRQPLGFFGSLPPDVSLGTSDSLGGWILGLTMGGLREGAKGDVWPLLADPTTSLDPSPTKKGPAYP